MSEWRGIPSTSGNRLGARQSSEISEQLGRRAARRTEAARALKKAEDEGRVSVSRWARLWRKLFGFSG